MLSFIDCIQVFKPVFWCCFIAMIFAMFFAIIAMIFYCP